MAQPQTQTTSYIQPLLIVLAMIAIIGLVCVSTFKATTPINVQTGPQSPERNILAVSGTHELTVAPDEAVLTFQVSTRALTASQASSQNRVALNSVMDALKKQGLDTDAIETTGVTLQRVYEWDYTNQKQLDKGYEQVTTLKVTTNDLTKVGSILDAAVAAGANNVQDVSFQLTKEKEAQYRTQALEEAAKVARSKAKVLADASGATLGRVTSVSETSYTQPWVYNTRAVAYDMKAGEAAAPSTPITPEKVSLSATVSISYELA